MMTDAAIDGDWVVRSQPDASRGRDRGCHGGGRRRLPSATVKVLLAGTATSGSCAQRGLCPHHRRRARSWARWWPSCVPCDPEALPRSGERSLRRAPECPRRGRSRLRPDRYDQGPAPRGAGPGRQRSVAQASSHGAQALGGLGEAWSAPPPSAAGSRRRPAPSRPTIVGTAMQTSEMPFHPLSSGEMVSTRCSSLRTAPMIRWSSMVRTCR